MCAASILSKDAAGVLPIAAVILFWVVTPRERRAKLASIAESILVAGFLAAFWYAYQGVVHPEWLWADNVKTQLIGAGSAGIETAVSAISTSFTICAVLSK